MPSHSFWLEEVLPEYPAFTGEAKTDVVVIGGGITGLTTACLLSRAGVRVILLEALSGLGKGTTGHTTAKITIQHNLKYDRLCRLWGQEVASLYAKVNTDAIDHIERLIAELGADCDFVRQNAFLYTTEQAGLLKLEQEAVIAQCLGIPLRMAYQSSLPMPVLGSLCFENQAMFHPIKYLKALAGAIQAAGGQIHCNSRAIRIENNLVETGQGKITADYIVLATHYPVVSLKGGYFARLYQSRSAVLAVRGIAVDGMYRAIESDGLSFRMQGDLLLLGGGSYRTGTQKNKSHYGDLRQTAATLQATPTDWQWATQDCMTPDELAFIGPHSKTLTRLLVATGFAKWGMTQSMVAAEILSDRILGRPNEAADVFAPGRSPLPATGHVLLNILSTAYHFFGGWLTRPTAPTCSHMGCKTQWNPEEQTWDCPCHGSRFDKDGRILDTPANKKVDM